MKILICSGIFPPEAGGPATYSKTLMEELRKRGHEVAIITYGDGNLKVSATSKDNVAEGFSPPMVIRISRSWFKPWHYYKYFRAVKKHGRDADILYVQDPVSAGYPTYLAAKFLKKPFAVKVTGDYSWEQAMNRRLTDQLIDEFQTLQEYPKDVRRMRDIQIRVCKEANVVIVPSEYLKKIVSGWGVKEKRLRVIYNSVAVPRNIQPVTRPPDKFLIVSSGRDVPWKGFAILREAIRGLGEKFDLRIINKLSRDEYLPILKSADAFVLNTGYEGFAHAVLEAMALGVPVITTRVGGNPEIVADGQTGLLIEYNNKEQLMAAIQKLHNDPRLRQHLAANARQSLSKFSLENMTAQTERELQQCAS